MSEAQASQYAHLHNTLYEVIDKGIGWSADAQSRHEARAMLSVWLQNCLSRPNSCFRQETIHWSPSGERIPFAVQADEDETEWLAQQGIEPDDEGNVPFVLHPIENDRPKEDELIRLAQTEIRQGRKLILGVRQTGTRDIQPHLQSLLTQSGIRAVILPDSLPPAKREAWIDKQVKDIDVLITNPRKIETGLDLVKFATIICCEVEYSLYTLWQFMRRVWRLGQTKPVRVLFLVYRDTMEEAALALIGEKMKAALLLYGDNAASAITVDADAGEASLLNELANRILKGEHLTTDGITGLLAPSISIQSTVDLFTEPSIQPEPLLPNTQRIPIVLPTADPTTHRLIWQETIIEQSNVATPPKLRKQQAAGQLSFFDLAAD
jgi:hypothetical protein